MSDDEHVQLDLTLSVTVVPQANNLALFVRLMDEIHRGTDDPAQLAEKLEVEERTVHYYIDFGRWLHLLHTPTQGEVHFSDTGLAFAESVAARARIFSQAMFARTLVKAVQALKRDSLNEDDIATIDTRTACLKAIRGMTDLSDSTAERRAGGLAHMLEAAYKPSRIDWETGEPVAGARRKLEYDGRSFATALGARQFGAPREFRIGWPKQVRLYVDNDGKGLSARVWKRASWNSSSGKAVWFGSVPINETTIDVVTRGGRDLRRFLVQVVPYISLAVAILCYRDRAGRPATRLTHDMYGLRLWVSERDIGTPIEVIERVAEQLDLVPTKAVPTDLQHADDDELEDGTEADLMAVLEAVGFVRRHDTTYELAPGIDAELRDARDDSASPAELLRPISGALEELLRAR